MINGVSFFYLIKLIISAVQIFSINTTTNILLRRVKIIIFMGL